MYTFLVSDQAKSSSLQKSLNFLVSLFHILESKYENLDPTFYCGAGGGGGLSMNKRNKNANISKETCF